MPDLRARFRVLDAIGDPPELRERITAGPSRPVDDAPSTSRRVAVALVALAIAGSAFTFAVTRLDPDGPASQPRGDAGTSTPTVTAEPSPTGLVSDVAVGGPVGVPNQTTALAVSRDAIWVAYYDDGGGHLAKVDPATLETVMTVDGVPTPSWESGGGGLAVSWDGQIWIGGSDRLVAVDERTGAIIVDRPVEGCCADVSIGALGSYVLLDATTDRAHPQASVHGFDPESGALDDATSVVGLVPRRIAQTGNGYVAVIGWTVGPDGGVSGTKVIPFHFEDPPDVVDGPVNDSGLTITGGGWTASAHGGVDLLDIAFHLERVQHVDVPVGDVSTIAETRHGVWVFGRSSIAVLDHADGSLREQITLRWEGERLRFDPSIGVASSRDGIYLLSRDGTLTALRF
jgi:hypothetical protein